MFYIASYYVYTYYDSDDILMRITDVISWSGNIFSSTMNDNMSQLLTMSLSLALFAISMLYLMFRIKKYIVGVAATVMMILLSPIFLVFFVCVEIPRYMLGYSKSLKRKQKKRNTIKSEVIENVQDLI